MLQNNITSPPIDFRNSFARFLINSAENFSRKPALWVNEQLYSYGEMITQGRSIAATLQALNLGTFNCGLLAYRSATIYQGIWGTLLAGGCYVPMNPRFPAAKNKAVLSAARCPVIIVDKRSEAAAKELLHELNHSVTVLLPEHEQCPEWCKDFDQQFLCQTQLKAARDWRQPQYANPYAYLLFTSGTTGTPKGIAVTHDNLKAYSNNILTRYNIGSSDRFSQVSDLTFDLSVHDLACAWPVGGALYVVPEASLLCPADFINRHQLTCWNSVPSLLSFIRKFGKMKPGAFPSLRYSFFCGEAFPMSLASHWQAATPNGRVINLYGPTETTVAITGLEYTECLPDTPNMPIGYVFPDQEAIVINSEGQLAEAREEGELLLGGSQVTQGYWHDPERSAKSFIEKSFPGFESERWYCTGDIVSQHAEYGLHFHGRKDFQVKVNGFRIELAEIESVIRKQFDCDWVAVIPWPVDADGIARGLVAWLSGENGNSQSVRQACIEKLPPYMVPGKVHWHPELPRNANGKVDIKALQQLTADHKG